MTLCTAVIGAFEALLFAMLGRVVDWLAAVEPARLWAEQRGSLLLLAAILAASPIVVALQTMLKHQTLAELAAQLPAARFVRVHHSWVVNVARPASLEEGRTAVMADGERVPVSRAGAARLKELLPKG